MKWIKENLLPLILTIALVCATFYLFETKRDNKRLHSDLIGKTEKIEFLNENVANLERSYVNQNVLLAKAMSEFDVITNNYKKRIKVLSNATFLIREKARKSGKSDIVYRGKRMKYIVNEIRYNDGPPVGYVLIFDDGRVVSKIYNHEINVKTLVARDEAKGNYDVVTRADYVLKSPAILNGWLNKPYALKIKGGTALIDPTEPNNVKKRYFWWAPQVNANININGINVQPGVGVSLSGYGNSKRDLDFKAFQFGAQYDKEKSLGFTLTPLLWRPLPKVLNNTYIGPGAYVDSSGQGYFFGVQIGL
tara:strand:+ start:74833 stop:75750 length:918 start_codon:yes stop_codon:yes gene_type:complete